MRLGLHWTLLRIILALLAKFRVERVSPKHLEQTHRPRLVQWQLHVAMVTWSSTNYAPQFSHVTMPHTTINQLCSSCTFPAYTLHLGGRWPQDWSWHFHQGSPVEDMTQGERPEGTQVYPRGLYELLVGTQWAQLRITLKSGQHTLSRNVSFESL